MHLNRLKLLLVVFVALLQCFVPLIHGHLGGHSGAHAHEGLGQIYAHIHADEFNPELLGAPATPTLTTPADESPAIGVSQEFKQDNFLLPILGVIVAVFLITASPSQTTIFPRRQNAAIRTVFHSRPPATAPPVWAA